MKIKSLSGKEKGSFAYVTIKDRLPVILTAVIDHLCREKININQQYGEEGSEDMKRIISEISKLKTELQTNKSLGLLTDPEDITTELWNSKILLFRNENGEDPKWFSTSWLFCECYMYKKIQNIFLMSKSLRNYDPFNEQKRKCFEDSLNNTSSLINYLSKEMNGRSKWQKCSRKKEDFLAKMIQFSLWGNKYDLSFTPGLGTSSEEDPSDMAEDFDDCVLVDEFKELWRYINKKSDRNFSLAVILDNAGFELVADLCLAMVLVEMQLFESVTFYIKSFPWFVSDTTREDLDSTLKFLSDQKGVIGEYGTKFCRYFEEGIWRVEDHPFWTLPHDFSEMSVVAPSFYDELSRHALIIFKGDLNYRKLVGDLDWPKETKLSTALRGFFPSPFLALRTIKGGPVVGLNLNSAAVERARLNEDWEFSGKFGVVQFVSKDNFSFKIKVALIAITAIVIPVLAASVLSHRISF